MSDYCRFIRDPDVPGGKYHVPGCWEGVQHEKTCDCGKRPSGRLTSQEQLDELEARCAFLEEMLEARDAS